MFRLSPFSQKPNHFQGFGARPRSQKRFQNTTASKSFTSPQKKELPKKTKYVVIGGGVIGCSVLYHLGKLGCKDAVLLEKNKLTSGTTWHSAGLLWKLRPKEIDIYLIGKSHALYSKQLEAETGQTTGWVNNGGLFIAQTKERMTEYKRLHTLGKLFGIESHLLSPEDAKKVHPLINNKDMYGALYSPGDGTISPSDLCSSYSIAIRNMGLQMFEDCGVNGFMIENGKVTGVKTDKGDIQCEKVVVCAGIWARKLAAKAGVSLPIMAMKHAYVVTEKIEGIRGLPNIRDHDSSVYLKLEGDGLSIGGYEPNPIPWDPVDNFAFSLFDLDWDHFEVHTRSHINRVPVIAQTGIKSTVCGPESFTPDHKAVVGEAPEVKNFYVCAGWNSVGIMSSGGIGFEMAHWLANGQPSRELYEYDIARYGCSYKSNERWLKERSMEAYGRVYEIIWPNDVPLKGREVRKSAFFESLKAAGAVYGERHGWERPMWFHPDGVDVSNRELHKLDYTWDWPKNYQFIGEECKATRERVALFDQSAFGKFLLEGKDADAVISRLCSGKVEKPPGSTTYTQILNSHGGVECDLTVSLLGSSNGVSSYYIVSGSAVGQHHFSYIKSQIPPSASCKFVDLSDDIHCLGLMGPKSRQLLEKIVDGGREVMSNQSFPFSTNKKITIGGHPVTALRITYVGELGWELHIPKEHAPQVFSAVVKAGAEFGLKFAGGRAVNSLRMEKGYREWSHELTPDETPLEAGIGFAVKLAEKTPFIGREVLEQQKAKGLTKRLICLTAGQTLLYGGEVIYRNGEIVGYLRSGSYGFNVGKSIGLGYVSNSGAHGGEKLVVTTEWLKEGQWEIEATGCNKVKAELHLAPLYDPKGEKIKC